MSKQGNEEYHSDIYNNKYFPGSKPLVSHLSIFCKTDTPDITWWDNWQIVFN